MGFGILQIYDFTNFTNFQLLTFNFQLTFIKNIFIIAGESSGDMHGASLIKAIKKIDDNFIFTGIGGPEMREENVTLLYDIKQVNFIGFSSVIRNYGKIKAIFNNCVDEVKKIEPEAIVLIDYPGFNLRFISKIREFYKGKIIYYISPQLWAWHKSRIKIIKAHVDVMLVVFPFEVEFYGNEKVRADFVGHPLMKRVDEFLFKNRKQKKDKLQISFLPGSRKDEIERIMPVMIETASGFKETENCDVSFICSPNYPLEYYQNFLQGKNFSLAYDNKGDELNYKTILNSDLVITKSGTSTVECALIGTPFCVVYKTGVFNYVIGKNLIKVDHIAMVNILLKKEAVKEFLQNEMTPENLLTEGKKILHDESYRNEMQSSFIELRKILTDKDASENAALIITDMLSKAGS